MLLAMTLVIASLAYECNAALLSYRIIEGKQAHGNQALKETPKATQRIITPKARCPSNHPPMLLWKNLSFPTWCTLVRFWRFWRLWHGSVWNASITEKPDWERPSPGPERQNQWKPSPRPGRPNPERSSSERATYGFSESCHEKGHDQSKNYDPKTDKFMESGNIW